MVLFHTQKTLRMNAGVFVYYLQQTEYLHSQTIFLQSYNNQKSHCILVWSEMIKLVINNCITQTTNSLNYYYYCYYYYYYLSSSLTLP